MIIPFVTSQHGRIQSLSIYKYAFTGRFVKDLELRKAFINEVLKKENIHIFEITNKHFSLFEPLAKMSSSAYNRVKKITIEAPFANTISISYFLGVIVKNEFSKHYKIYLNKNIFGVTFYDLGLFRLIKGFEFNIEVFSNGDFYIHLLPVSKIVSNNFINEEYISKIIIGAKNGIFYDFKISIINSMSFKSIRLDLSLEDDLKRAIKLIQSDQKYVATFDYHFMANYSPETFAKITKLTEKGLSSSIEFLSLIIDKLKYPSWIKTDEKRFIRFNMDKIGGINNLLVGGNAAVKEQKAAFYNGVYLPVSDKIIIPLLNEEFGNISLFYELFNSFNKNGQNIEILDPIKMNLEDELFIKEMKRLRNKYRLRGKQNKKILLLVFTKYTMVKDDMKKLQDLGLMFQIYLGDIDKYQLSNFIVKCIEKLGGILNIIKDTQEPKSTYFIGIDLGHSTHEKNKELTNLGVVLFNNQGIYLNKYVNKGIARNEALTLDAIEKPLTSLMLYINENNLEAPKKFIIHRDGKLHKIDIDNLLRKIVELFDIHDVDIVEIIKSGYPVLAKYDTVDKVYLNLESGDCWTIPEQSYAIMVTNIQADSKNAVLNPIIIKHRFGDTDFMKILHQTYWFTKIYTNNLYNSTRLPATTLKANNIVSTSDKIHISTNLG